MIIASLSKIWHLIPIVIAIVVFKKYISYKDKKHRIIKNEENEKNGLNLKLRTIKKYEDLSYKVEELENEEGIDLFCYKEEKRLLFYCKDISKPKSIKEEDIKLFYNNAMNYLKKNDIKENSVEFRYIVPYSDVFHKSAIKVLSENSYNCKYVVL